MEFGAKRGKRKLGGTLVVDRIFLRVCFAKSLFVSFGESAVEALNQ